MPTEPTDGGPLYAETDLSRIIAEPCNALSALAFLVLVAVWMVRLRGRYRQHPFLTGCLPLLAAGGLGGTLYHASRRSYALYMLDVVPIFLLALAVSLYLWVRLARRWWYLLAVVPPYSLTLGISRSDTSHRAITATYLLLAALMLMPALLVLRLTRFRGASWMAAAVGLFAVALGFRSVDFASRAWLPVGTHWLWHLLGAAATQATAEWVYRLELMPQPSAAPTSEAAQWG
jgi:hemolysin III